jgi:hypothetical protein
MTLKERGRSQHADWRPALFGWERATDGSEEVQHEGRLGQGPGASKGGGDQDGTNRRSLEVQAVPNVCYGKEENTNDGSYQIQGVIFLTTSRPLLKWYAAIATWKGTKPYLKSLPSKRCMSAYEEADL